MGGEMGVSSHVGGGSNFHFNLPLEAAQSGAPAVPEAGSGAPAAGKLPASSDAIRILIAEDTEDNRLLIEHYLRSELVELRFAFTGQEALDAVRRGEKFDLILMDIDMPVLDGIEATKAIRAWEESHGGSTPIVALTADAMSDAVHASLNAGCVAHVAKPVERGTLLKTIQRYANGHRARPNPGLGHHISGFQGSAGAGSSVSGVQTEANRRSARIPDFTRFWAHPPLRP
jgi:CheY-like chemotaxis protein